MNACLMNFTTGMKNIHCGGLSHRRGNPIIRSLPMYSDGDARQYSWARATVDMEPCTSTSNSLMIFCESNSAQLAENHSFFTFSSMEFFVHMNKLIPCCTIVKGFIFDLVPVSLVDLEPESS